MSFTFHCLKESINKGTSMSSFTFYSAMTVYISPLDITSGDSIYANNEPEILTVIHFYF